MNKIEVRNSCIVINDYNWGDCPKIENQFRIYERITHQFLYLGIWYDEEDKRLYLSRGIDVWYVEDCIGAKAVYTKDYYKYDYIGNAKLKVGPRDDRQKEILRFCVGQGEYKNTEFASQLSVNANTGFGKTYISIATIAYFEIKSIIITYSVNWLNQWKERIQQYTGIKANEILLISGSASINRLLKMEDTSRYKIFMITHSTIKSYSTKYGWKAIGKLFEHLKIGIKIYDEAHLNFVNMAMIDFYTNVYKTYYLTATPIKSSEEENRIYNLYFKNVKAITLFDKEVDPHTKYIAIKFNSNPSVFDISECKNAYGLDRNKYINYLVNKPEYFRLLTIIMDLALKTDGKVLIYIGTNAAIMVTYKYLMMRYPELGGNIGIFTTLVSKEEKELNKDKKIILSTTKSAGASMDIDNLKMTVVINEPFKSHVLARQTLGRTRADNTFYIDCVDLGFNQLRRYYNYKRPVFDEYALSCSEIFIRQPDLEYRYNDIVSKRNQEKTMPLITAQLVTFEE